MKWYECPEHSVLYQQIQTTGTISLSSAVIFDLKTNQVAGSQYFL